MAVGVKMRRWRWQLFGIFLVVATLPVSWLFRTTIDNLAVACIKFVWSSLGLETPAVTEDSPFWVGAILLAAFVYAIYRVGLMVAAVRNPTVFANRNALDSTRPGAAFPLDEAETAHCVWLTGSRAFNADTGLEKIKKLILPNPSAASTEKFQSSIEAGIDFCNMIKTTTQSARERKIDVRWYPEFIGAAWWIGDRDKSSAFVHFELILPFSVARSRPSFRIHRWQDEQAYDEHCRVFDKMWDISQTPSEATDG